MRPVRKLLGDERLILLSPDGVLSLVPFGALVDEQGRYLVESYTIDYLLSGRDLLRLETRFESRQPPVVFANPTFDRAVTTGSPSAGRADTAAGRRSSDFNQFDDKPLPGTAAEASAIRAAMPAAQLFTESQATEAALKRVTAPLVLHIATHGFFLRDQQREAQAGAHLPEQAGSPRVAWRENPLLRSGLVLAGVNEGQSGAREDGVLTALEAAGLDLWGTKLVVLSACQTGVGDVTNGEGVLGLRRALVLAGSEAQVLSLWKVPDAGTPDLMSAYYARLRRGEGRAEALRQVQLAMLRGSVSDYRHPFYWAAFIPSGDWRNFAGQDR
jgi:CHAT domain-containing protein